MRLGIFGGTFDPPHVGHLIVADDALAALGLDRVVFLPAGTHPLKRSEVEAPSEIRLEMVRMATDGDDRFVVDDRDTRRSGPSYTVDTLGEFVEEFPGAELVLLVGADILREIHRWHRVDEIARRARITVMSRPGFDEDHRPRVDLEYRTIEVTPVGISSTEIRRRVRSGEPYRYLVPEPVYRIMRERALYKERARHHNEDAPRT